MKVPNPHWLLRRMQEVEEDLLTTETPSEAGPLLMERYNLIYLLVVLYKFGNVRSNEIYGLIYSDQTAREILESLEDGLSKTENGANDAQGEVDLPQRGLLSRFDIIP